MKFSLVQRKMYINSQLLILKLSLEKKYIREFLNLFISLHPVFAGQLFLLFTTSPYKSKKCQLNDIMYLSYLRECIENRTWLRIQAGKFRATMIQHFTVSFLKRESMMQTFILFLLFILVQTVTQYHCFTKKKKWSYQWFGELLYWRLLLTLLPPLLYILAKTIQQHNFFTFPHTICFCLTKIWKYKYFF